MRFELEKNIIYLEISETLLYDTLLVVGSILVTKIATDPLDKLIEIISFLRIVLVETEIELDTSSQSLT